MGFSLFGKREKLPIPTREEYIRDAVKYIVNNDYYLQNGHVMRASTSLYFRSSNPKYIITGAVTATVESFKDKSATYVAEKVQEVKDKLLTEALILSITEEILDDALDAARGRALVKGFRAGLDRSEAYLKLMSADTVKEIESIERWIERSNAYKAIEGS